jgi:pyruvate dehydrogenase E1 component alpha subunit
LEKARSGGGPTFIECVTYRMADHTTADDAARYRPKEIVEAWRGKDPVLRLARFMERKGLWNEAYAKDVGARAQSAIDAAVDAAEALEPPQPRDIFDYTYAEPTLRQLKQIKDL